MSGRPQYQCRCGFPCYSPDQVRYHKDGACFVLRRVMSVVAARERTGRREHAGVRVGRIMLKSA